MKLQKPESIMNLGDTSFRRAQLIDDYKIMLPLLVETFYVSGKWGTNNDSQSTFYGLVANSGLVSNEFFDDFIKAQNGDDLERLKSKYQKTIQARFKRTYKSSSDIPLEDMLDYFSDEQKKRGRTYSSALYKIGLVDVKRRITEVGESFIKGKVKLDNLEKLLQLDSANIIFLRQLLKLRVYHPNREQYYYPARIGLYLLAKYESIISTDFTTIINLIRPTMNSSDILGIINDYENVLCGNITSGEYFDKHFPETSGNQNIEEFYQYGANSLDVFKLFFVNRKSPSAIHDYYDLFLTLIEFNTKPSNELVKRLVEISKKDSVKKAFGFRKSLFEEKKGESWQMFKERYIDSLLLEEDLFKFRRAFYSTFSASKRYDLIYEYRDMTVRTLNLSGVIIFDKKIARLGQKWITVGIFRSSKFETSFSGNENMELYEGDKLDPFYRELTMMEILDISTENFTGLIETVKKSNGLDDSIDLSSYFEEKFYQDFIQKINQRFSNQDIIEILSLFEGRLNDNKISDRVTNLATISTIFEYILAIAWHRISGQSYNLFNSLNLTLDADFYPISHAPGGDGDIVIDGEDYCLMLEATLMDKNAQKRGELEPVIRHTANLAIRQKDKPVFTIFVADELDNNVINIFRAVYYTELESTQQRGQSIEGVKIFSLSISELIEVMNKNVKDKKIIDSINKNYEVPLSLISRGWRKQILEDIFS